VNQPSLAFFACICLFLFGWKGKLAACFISGYEIVEGIRWMSAGSGLFDGISERLNIVMTSDSIQLWELLDLQYLLALVIFIAAFIYLLTDILRTKEMPSGSYT